MASAGLQAHITYLAGMTANVDQKIGRDAIERYEVLRTRLLDWTRNAFVAAYFAAEEASNQESGKDEKLSVWALYYPVMGVLHEIERWHQPIIIVTPPAPVTQI